uniref:Uncharacterized protein n=1 Tax=Rhizophora mucronata TaxID=61149 RepID=A0A2P2IPE3_RHIMU
MGPKPQDPQLKP